MREAIRKKILKYGTPSKELREYLEKKREDSKKICVLHDDIKVIRYNQGIYNICDDILSLWEDE